MKIRKAFVMSVNSGAEEEYEKRHNPIWAELEKTLKDHGASNYSIFLHPETRQLFGYVEIESEERWAAVASTDICRKWCARGVPHRLNERHNARWRFRNRAHIP